jgi:hypothetical protein
MRGNFDQVLEPVKLGRCLYGIRNFYLQITLSMLQILAAFFFEEEIAIAYRLQFAQKQFLD